MHPHLSGSLIILLFFLPCCLSADYEYYTKCAPSSCGSIQSISYPFRLNNQPVNCGHPGFNLSCINGSADIEMASKRYRVMNISYDSNILKIVDKDFIDTEEKCPLLSSNTTINATIFNYTTQNQNITLYYNCPYPIPLDSSHFYPVPCSSHANVYAFFTFEQFISFNQSFQHCNVGFIPVMNFPTSFFEALESGFELQWKVDSGRCKECTGSGGRCGFSASFTSVCFCRDGPHSDKCPEPLLSNPPSRGTVPSDRGKAPPGERKDGKRRMAVKIVIGTSAAACGVFLLACLLYLRTRNNHYNLARRYWSTKSGSARNVEDFLKNYGILSPKRYTYSDLKKITNSFRNKLGQGGYGGVFKGMLQDGRLVAVKVLKESKGNGEEFINEVASIGRTHHVNIVMLLGFCSEGSKRALVYEFMPNGSLEKFIYSEKAGRSHSLGWEKLHQIAIGVARGLEYLHRGCSMRILHFDIKPHNILLDQDFCPKIADFGLAKLCPARESIISMLDARGTVGFIAPEVFCRNIGGVSYKSDVYSYGMMVLEMVGGRKNIDALVENTSEVYFPHWIYKHLTYEHLELHGHLGLHEITTKEEEETARKMILVGLWCIQTNPTDRPSMSRVLEMLEGSVDSLQIPPQPFLSSSSS